MRPAFVIGLCESFSALAINRAEVSIDRRYVRHITARTYPREDGRQSLLCSYQAPYGGEHTFARWPCLPYPGSQILQNPVGYYKNVIYGRKAWSGKPSLTKI